MAARTLTGATITQAIEAATGHAGVKVRKAAGACHFHSVDATAPIATVSDPSVPVRHLSHLTVAQWVDAYRRVTGAMRASDTGLTTRVVPPHTYDGMSVGQYYGRPAFLSPRFEILDTAGEVIGRAAWQTSDRWFLADATGVQCLAAAPSLDALVLRAHAMLVA